MPKTRYVCHPTSLRHDIRTLMEEAGGYHRQGKHALALDCYRKAVAIAAPANIPLLLAQLYAGTGQ